MKTTPPDSPGTQPRSAQPRRCPPSLRLQQGQHSHHNTCNLILYLKQHVWIDFTSGLGSSSDMTPSGMPRLHHRSHSTLVHFQ